MKLFEESKELNYPQPDENIRKRNNKSIYLKRTNHHL